MKKSLLKGGIIVALLLGLSVQSYGQESQSQLKAKLEKKLASDFMSNADWITNYDEARKKAKETKKLIFGYFTRSFRP